jgi:hypothetical protein
VEIAMRNLCKDCEHFRQHYIQYGGRYWEILYGHCVYPRLKKRETQSPACDRYSPRAAAEKSGETRA